MRVGQANHGPGRLPPKVCGHDLEALCLQREVLLLYRAFFLIHANYTEEQISPELFTSGCAAPVVTKTIGCSKVISYE